MFVTHASRESERVERLDWIVCVYVWIASMLEVGWSEGERALHESWPSAKLDRFFIC